MASVMRCDICRDMYDKPKEPNIHSCYMVYGQVNYDICPNCTKKVREFIETLKRFPNKTRYEVIVKHPETETPWYEVPGTTEVTNV